MHFDRLSDAEIILLVLSAFYLSECVAWMREGAVWFASQLGGRCRLVLAGLSFGHERGGPVLAHFLPTGRSFLCEHWPVSLSPEGVYSYVATATSPNGRPDQPGHYLRFDEIETIEVAAHSVLINGRPFITAGSARRAALIARTVRQLAALPQSERDRAIEGFLAASTDVSAASARLAELARRGNA